LFWLCGLKMEKIWNLSVFLILFAFHVILSEAVSFDADTSLNAGQAQALKQFKKRVLPKLKRDFEKEDIYLVQFLRAKKFDVDRAEEFILSEAKWRTEQGFDTVHKENWEDMECCYTVRHEGVDREGRPLVLYDLGSWDVRAAVLAGKRDRLVKWMFKNIDMARIRARDLGKQGKNVTRFDIIFDLKGFNLATHLTASAIPVYVISGAGFDRHFPNMADSIFTISTPAIFEAVLSVVKPVLAQGTRDSLQIYGQSDWVEKIRERIDPKQLIKRYGGTKDEESK